MTTRTNTKGAFGALLTSLAVLLLGSSQPSLAAPPPLTDLATLGGDFTFATGINAVGQIIGYSYPPSSGDQHAVSWDAVVPLTIEDDFGNLGGSTTTPVAINAAGQVAGYATNALGKQHAVVWTAAHGINDLGTLGGTFSEATAINATGQIAGFATTAGDAKTHAVFWDAAAPYTIHDLGTLGGTFSKAVAINTAGQIVGFATTAGDAETHAVVWDAAPPYTIHDLGTLGGTSSAAVAINAAGQIAGNATTLGGDTHAVVWDAAHVIQDLGTLGSGTSSQAVAINASGQVVGNATTAGGDTHAVVWNAAHLIQDLGTLGGTFSQAFGINASGQVVGDSDTGLPGERFAFVWDATNVMQDLGTLGGTSSSPVGINDDGQIAGFSLIAGDAAFHAFVVTVPPFTPLLAADGIIWHQPLARRGMCHDTDPSAGNTLKYRFKLGSTIPIKVHALSTTGTDVTNNSNVTGKVVVFGDTDCDGLIDGNDPALLIDYNGVGEAGGMMDKICGHLQYNLDTKKLPRTFRCYILQVTITDTSTGQTIAETLALKSK